MIAVKAELVHRRNGTCCFQLMDLFTLILFNLNSWFTFRLVHYLLLVSNGVHHVTTFSLSRHKTTFSRDAVTSFVNNTLVKKTYKRLILTLMINYFKQCYLMSRKFICYHCLITVEKRNTSSLYNFIYCESIRYCAFSGFLCQAYRVRRLLINLVTLMTLRIKCIHGVD